MSIIQISKILHRTGNLVDLPQLDAAELGWANDNKRLFIGTSVPNPAENVEVLTSYSNISFSQIVGTQGNLDIVAASNGEVLSFDGTNWINKGGTAGGLINLGDLSNVKIGGGAIGYVLETDGLGTLSWTSKGTLLVNINSLSDANPIVMNVPNTTPYINKAAVTISAVDGTNTGIVNGLTFYISVAPDFGTTGNVSLYTDLGLTSPADGTGLIATPSTGIAVSSISGGGAASIAGGSNATVQFNNSGITDGSTDLTFDSVTKILELTGTANVSGNVNAGNVVTLGIVHAIGNVTGSNLMGVHANGTSNVSIPAASGNVNISVNGNANVVAVSGIGANVTGYANVSGNISSGNANLGNAATANFFIGSGANLTSIPGGNVSGAVGLATFAGTANAVAGGNVSGAVGLATYATTANAVAGANVSGQVSFAATANTVAGANVTGTVGLATYATTANAVAGGNVSGAVGLATYATTANAVAGANVSGQVSFAATANAVAGGNVSGAVGLATYATTANAVAGGNVSGAVGLATYATTANAVAGGNVSGQVSYAATANAVAGGNVSGQVNYAATANAVAGANVSGTVGSASTAGTVTTAAQPNITSVGTLSSLTTTTITTGANITAGTLTGNWTLSTGSKLQSTYADLAERYVSDFDYLPGTVLEFGGPYEVTLGGSDTTRVAGVVSQNAAYIMNASCEGSCVVDLALQGRVKVFVLGAVSKGDMLISAGAGYAYACQTPKLGQVIGKSLENRAADSDNDMIEVVVGRM